MTIKVSIQSENFDIASEIERLTRGRADIGATVSFTGHCRDEGGRLAALELEHYPGMAEAEIARICEQAVSRFELLGLTVIHRFGRMAPGDLIVVVLAAASHRQAAFDGAAFVMDFLKTDAPFWKKEHLKSGDSGDWVTARDADEDARLRWL
ncbi:molybdenum cofactor biosynthesis protein MoaE [Martelella limonii]|uniref:molybdenum cofactor biosynthesis protein MoaE n=1 Tax=Martelella limonii TaxID=1647649 RepID=UPI0015804AF6|nr:molybdenum cofactor biosynthesis protein MoaE [Martelella limonii]